MKEKVREHFEKIVEKTNKDNTIEEEEDEILDEDIPLSEKLIENNQINETNEDVPTERHIKIAELFIRSYEDGIEFIHLIEDAVPTMCKLLASTSKPEVLEVMDFFVRIHYYQMECAEVNIFLIYIYIFFKNIIKNFYIIIIITIIIIIIININININIIIIIIIIYLLLFYIIIIIIKGWY